MKEKDQQKDEEIKLLKERLTALEKSQLQLVAQPAAPQQINNYHAPVTNNNINVNININNYNQPTIDGMNITAAELEGVNKLTKFLLQKIYFNPALPQNHCIYLQNKKDKSLILFENNNWRQVTGDNLPEVMTKLNNTIASKGTEIINSKNGPYEASDKKFLELPGATQYKITNFNSLQEELGHDDAYEVFYGGRDVVLGTIREAGCKLI